MAHVARRSHARVLARSHAVRITPPPSPMRMAAQQSRPGDFPFTDPRGKGRTHALLDDFHEPVDDGTLPRSSPPGLTPRQQADSIVNTIVHSQGPILLCMPGTLGAAWQSTMYETARAFVREHGGPMVAVSIPYQNSIMDAVTRFFGMHSSEKESVLALVIRDLKRLCPGRPILVTGESQGAWAVAHDLQDPELASAVTRVALFAKPGFQHGPSPAVGQAALGAGTLPGRGGSIEFRHTDDIVPSLFRHLGLGVLTGYLHAGRRWLANHDFEYIPHHYDAHGAEAAHYLLTGEVPTDLVHGSDDDM